MNTEQQQKFFQEAAAAAAEAASAANVRTPTSGVTAASNPYLAAAALAQASSISGNPTSAYLQPPLGSFPPVTQSTGAENSWLMNPLFQAAIRQQWMSQLATMSAATGAPFMNPLAASMASLSGAFPSPVPPRLPLLIPKILDGFATEFIFKIPLSKQESMGVFPLSMKIFQFNVF